MTYLYFFASQPRLQRRFVSLIATGCALALTGCTDGGASSSTQTISYDGFVEIDVQPIQVCDNHGGDCAEVNMFADITAAILEQAQLKVNFLPTNQLNDSRFLQLSGSGSNNEFYEISRLGEPGDYGRHEDSTRTSGPINVWFVDEIVSSSSATQFGLAWVDANGVAISSATLDYNNGRGRTDTVAHEIGHNLGLQHSTLGAGGKDNLLTDGNTRLTPNSIDDIGSEGAGLSTLTDSQIREIRSSGFVKGSEGDTAADVATADTAVLADMTAEVTTGQLNTLLPSSFADTEETTFESTQLAGGVDFASLKLSQLNSTQSSVARVPEPSTLAGLFVLSLTIFGARKTRASQM